MSNNAAAASLDLPQQVIAAWADNDGNAFAELFAEDGTMILPNDVYLSGREEIRAYLKAAFDGPYKGTRVVGVPLSMKTIDDVVVIITTRGGVVHPGEQDVAPERAIRATWVLAKQDDGWFIAAYQNTPIS
jgi:uncharacterized protein (TIGR02246 family)